MREVLRALPVLTGSAPQFDLAQAPDDPVELLTGWLPHAVHADSVEFWQADPQRKHRRLRYERDDTGWSRTLLWP